MGKKGLTLPKIDENGSPSPQAMQDYNDRYAKCMEALNYNIQGILDDFEAEALPLLRDLSGAKPATIQTQLKEQKGKLVKMVAEMSKYIDPLSSNGYRIVVMDTVKNLIDAYSKFLMDTFLELQESVGEKSN